MKKQIILITVILFVSININAQTWQSFTSENSALPNNSVRSIAIGNDGTVWFATDDGLAAYNNEKWSEYSTQNGLSNNKVNAVSFDPLNSASLLIASDSGLTIVNVDSTGFTSQPEYINKSIYEILSDTILTTDIDGFDNNWVGSDKGLSVITNSGIYSFNEENGFRNTYVNTVKVLAENWAHIGTSGGGVSRLKYNGIDGITSASDIITTWSMLPSDTVLSIYVTDDTLRWFGTTQGVATHFGERTKDGPITEGGSWWIYNTFTSGIIDNYVKAITQDNDGNMWFGTKEGISKLSSKDETWTSYTEDDGLLSNNIFDIKIDNENNLWIATDKGVSYLADISTSVTDEKISREYEIKLSNYPNPFNPKTNIEYSIPTLTNVRLEVFDNLGRSVKVLVEEQQNEGTYKVSFNIKKNSSGIYLYRLSTDQLSITKKMLLLK